MHNPALSSFMNCDRGCSKSNTTCVVSGAGTACPSWVSEFTPVFSGVRTVQSLVYYVVFCRLLFVLFLLAIVWSVLLRFTASDYLFGILDLRFSLSLWYLQTFLLSVKQYSRLSLYIISTQLNILVFSGIVMDCLNKLRFIPSSPRYTAIIVCFVIYLCLTFTPIKFRVT